MRTAAVALWGAEQHCARVGGSGTTTRALNTTITRRLRLATRTANAPHAYAHCCAALRTTVGSRSRAATYGTAVALLHFALVRRAARYLLTLRTCRFPLRISYLLACSARTVRANDSGALRWFFHYL